jgi:hypothetical protein
VRAAHGFAVVAFATREDDLAQRTSARGHGFTAGSRLGGIVTNRCAL